MFESVQAFFKLFTFWVVNKDTELFAVRMQQTCLSFTFALQ